MCFFLDRKFALDNTTINGGPGKWHGKEEEEKISQEGRFLEPGCTKNRQKTKALINLDGHKKPVKKKCIRFNFHSQKKGARKSPTDPSRRSVFSANDQ